MDQEKKAGAVSEAQDDVAQPEGAQEEQPKKAPQQEEADACEEEPTQAEWRAALETALSPAFRQKAAGANSPYDGGPTAARITAALEQWAQSPAFGRPKTCYDAPCKEEQA